MAKPSKSKNPSEADDEVLDADAESDLDAGKKSPSTDNVTGDQEVTLDIVSVYTNHVIAAS